MLEESTLILIPCSAKKTAQAITHSSIPPQSILDQLPSELANRLESDRAELIAKIRRNEISNASVNLEITPLQAFIRYIGALFQEASLTWSQIDKDSNLDVLIVSALYGLVDFREEILYYNARMEQTKRFWKQKKLIETLSSYVTQKKIARIYNLLPRAYCAPLQGFLGGVEIINTCIWEKEGKLLGSASLGKKGKWIHEIVLNSRIPSVIDNFRITYQVTDSKMRGCRSESPIN